jgi:hypothetical protein
MAKFFKGVEDTTGEDREWMTTLDPRPSRLALGADPKSLTRRKDHTATDKKLMKMVKPTEESSDSDHEGSRASIGFPK